MHRFLRFYPSFCAASSLTRSSSTFITYKSRSPPSLLTPRNGMQSVKYMRRKQPPLVQRGKTALALGSRLHTSFDGTSITPSLLGTPFSNLERRETKYFGTKRVITKNGNDLDDSNFQGISGAITIYNEQKTLPNINIDRIEKSISIIRDIINYPTYDVNLVLVDDEEMQQTNFETRNINKPTDILSFPFHETICGTTKSAGSLQEPDFDVPDYYNLGDMIVDVPYVLRRCEEDKVHNERMKVSVLEQEVGNSLLVNDSNMHEMKEHEESEIIEEELYEDYVDDDYRGVSGAMATIYDPEERISMLLVHGMLHLVGYDHNNDEDYEVMVTKEEEVLELLKERLQ